MSATERVWRRQAAQVSDALRPWAFTANDGTPLIRPDAPEELLSIYKDLLSVGYANGWVAGWAA